MAYNPNVVAPFMGPSEASPINRAATENIFFLDAGYEPWGEELVAGKYGEFLRGHEAQRISANSKRSVWIFSWNGKQYFFKWHLGRRNAKWGIREWHASEALEKTGIAVAQRVATGVHPSGDASFFLCEAIAGGESLESYLEREGGRFGPGMLEALVGLVSTLHKAKMVHKDLYLGHLFWIQASRQIALIDLARVQRHAFFFWRWRVKDLASLLFSSSLLKVSPEDKIAFFHLYLGREALRLQDKTLAFCARIKARRIRRHTARVLSRITQEMRENTPHNDLGRVLQGKI